MGRNNSERPVHTERDSNGDKNGPDKALVHWTRMVGVFTGLLFIASAFSDYIIWRELSDSEQARVFSEQQQRAFFNLGAIAQMPGVDKNSGETEAFSIQWVNIGATRTEWADGWASIQYFPDKAPDYFDASKPRDHVSSAHSVVGANQPLTVSPVAVNTGEYALASAGNGALLAWGAVDYADIFNPSIVHEGHFCVQLVPGGYATDTATQKRTIIWKPQPYRDSCNKTE